jgi:hypothetical protein
MGWMPFLVYSGFLIFVHHITFFMLESWSWVSLLSVLVKILTSFITSMSFILVYILLFTKQSSARA